MPNITLINRMVNKSSIYELKSLISDYKRKMKRAKPDEIKDYAQAIDYLEINLRLKKWREAWDNGFQSGSESKEIGK